MTTDLRAAADARLEQALSDARAADPRPALRDALRDLRDRNADGFERARRFYEDSVLPHIADGSVDPLSGWIEYGRFVAELDGSGRVLAVAEDGRSTPATDAYRPGSLVLFFPDDQRRRALLLVAPIQPAPPQQATLALLL